MEPSTGTPGGARGWRRVRHRFYLALVAALMAAIAAAGWWNLRRLGVLP